MVMNKLFIIRLAAIIFAILVTITQTEKLIIFGCYIYIAEMIAIFIDVYVHKLPDKFIMYLVDIAFTIPGWCFVAQFVSINEWFNVIMFSLLSIGGLIGVYYNHKNNHKHSVEAFNKNI